MPACRAARPRSPRAAVGAEADDAKITKLLAELSGKDLAEVIKAGSAKLASVPSGGGGGAAAPAAAAAGGAKKEEKKEEKEEEEEVVRAPPQRRRRGRRGSLPVKPPGLGHACSHAPDAAPAALRRTWASPCSTKRLAARVASLAGARCLQSSTRAVILRTRVRICCCASPRRISRARPTRSQSPRASARGAACPAAPRRGRCAPAQPPSPPPSPAGSPPRTAAPGSPPASCPRSCAASHSYLRPCASAHTQAHDSARERFNALASRQMLVRSSPLYPSVRRATSSSSRPGATCRPLRFRRTRSPRANTSGRGM